MLTRDVFRPIWQRILYAPDDEGGAAEEDDNLEGAEDDDELEEDPDYPPQERFVVEEDEDDTPKEEPSQSDLIQQLVGQMQQQNQNQSQAEKDETASAIRELVGELKQQNKPKEEDPRKTAEQRRQEYEQLKNEAKENFFDNPVEYIEKLLQHNTQTSREELYPVLNQIVGNVSESSKKISRTAAREDSTNALVLDNYKDEVEAEVAKLPATADVYSQACQRVAQRHLSEIVQMQVEEQLEQRRKPKPTRRAANQSPQGRSDQSRSGRPSRTVAEGQFRVTQKELDMIKRVAANKQVDEETAYNYLVDRGQVKHRS